MSKNPKVSVLMATRNNGRTLHHAIESIVVQTFQKWELILVDDGSTDNTADVVGQVRDERIRIIRHSVSQGLAVSLNSAAKIAKGEFFARMDADDVSSAERLARQLEVFRARPELDVLGTGVRVRASGELMTWTLPCEHSVLVANIHRANPFFHPTVMLRRTFFLRQGGYSARMQRAQDYDLWLRGRIGSVYSNLPDALLNYSVSSPKLRNALYSSKALLLAAQRERSPRFLMAAIRPIAAWIRAKI